MLEKYQPTIIYTGCIPKRRTHVGSRWMTEDVPLVNCIPHSHVPDDYSDYPAAFENNERKVISWTDVCVCYYHRPLMISTWFISRINV